MSSLLAPPVRAAAPRASWPPRKDFAVIGLTFAGMVLLLASLSSPWFYFHGDITNPDDEIPSMVFQERLAGEWRTDGQANVEMVTYILVAAAIISAASSCLVAGWLALRRWHSGWAAALAVCLLPIIFAVAAPVYYGYELPHAKMAAYNGIPHHSYYSEDYGPPTDSPEVKFFGSGEDVRYYSLRNYDYFYDYDTFDKAQWGGSAGFYLAIAAAAMFIIAYGIVMANVRVSFRERKGAVPA